MADVTLSVAVRQNLLSLQGTTDLISRTQNRLSTGLRVSSPIDDPVSYFQAKGLNDRASDFQEKKDSIDQGISSLTAATDAIDAIESLVQQLKGLATNAKSSTTTTQVSNLVDQFNDLRAQINNLTTDASYQGLNLVNGTGTTLTVNFSNDTASTLAVASVDITSDQTGLSIDKFSLGTQGINFNVAYVSAGTLTGAGSGGLTQAGTITLTVGGQTASAISSGDTFTFQYGTATVTLGVATDFSTDYTTAGAGTISAGTYSVGSTITLYLVTDAGAITAAGTSGIANLKLTGASVALSETQAQRSVGVGFTTTLNSAITELDSALTTLRSKAQTLGSNVALLQTRLDFTQSYVNTLAGGAGKLTLADLNEEGANLLALQTRQQLGIQSLAFAGQSESSILGLFR